MYGGMGTYNSMYGGGMGYGGSMGIDGQHSWIHGIQNFTSSLTYFTEVSSNYSCMPKIENLNFQS